MVVPFRILLGPYLDKSYSAAGRISGRFISRANWMMRMGWGQNSRGTYRLWLVDLDPRWLVDLDGG